MDGIKGNDTQEFHRAMPMVVKKEKVPMEDVVMGETGSHRFKPSKANNILPLQQH